MAWKMSCESANEQCGNNFLTSVFRQHLACSDSHFKNLMLQKSMQANVGGGLFF